MRAIGVDLGGTKLRIATVSESGSTLGEVEYKTDVLGGYRAILGQISEGVRSLSKTDLGIGVGIPGQVDAVTGVVHAAPNLFWKELSLQHDLEKMVQMPVKIINDVRAATLAEWRFGAGQGASDIVSLFVGTGIGGGIIANKQLVSGATNCAGEFGHTIIGSHKRVCRCGAVGCLEAFASGFAIAERAKEAVKEHPTLAEAILRFAGGEEITSHAVALAYNEGDHLAKEIISLTQEMLLIGCINIVHSFNPSRLILGGGVIIGFPDFVSAIDQGIKERGLKSATKELQVVAAKLGNNAGVIGAASQFF